MRKMLGIMLAFVLVFGIAVGAAAAQVLVEEWVSRYNGLANSSDLASAIAVDSSGNVYVTGRSWGSVTSYDYGTVKYDSAGNVIWEAHYDGTANSYNESKAIAVDSSGNVYVTGYSYYESGTSDEDFATVKYDSAGNMSWVAHYNGTANTSDIAYAIAVDSSGLYVTGYSDESGSGADYTTVKYDTNGNQLWVSHYNGPANSRDLAQAMAIDSSGNVYVTGHSYGGSGTLYDYATVKYAANGTQLWARRYDGPSNSYSYDWANAIAVDSSGNVYVTGRSWGGVTREDYATVAYSSGGTELWVARYNGPGNGFDWAHAIDVDSSSVYVTGRSTGSGTSNDYATVAYSSGGTELWVAIYNGTANTSDIAYAIAVDSGDVYVTGQSGGDYATVKYDSAGSVIWEAHYNGPGNGFDWASAIAVDSSGVYVTGTSTGSGTGYDYATIKYNRTPEEQIETIKIDVDMHYSEDDISTGKYKGMKRKLNEAFDKLEAGNERAACNKLHDFIDQVNAAINSDPLTQEEGQVLIDAANDIINELCGQR